MKMKHQMKLEIGILGGCVKSFVFNKYLSLRNYRKKLIQSLIQIIEMCVEFQKKIRKKEIIEKLNKVIQILKYE